MPEIARWWCNLVGLLAQPPSPRHVQEEGFLQPFKDYSKLGQPDFLEAAFNKSTIESLDRQLGDPAKVESREKIRTFCQHMLKDGEWRRSESLQRGGVTVARRQLASPALVNGLRKMLCREEQQQGNDGQPQPQLEISLYQLGFGMYKVWQLLKFGAQEEAPTEQQRKSNKLCADAAIKRMVRRVHAMAVSEEWDLRGLAIPAAYRQPPAAPECPDVAFQEAEKEFDMGEGLPYPSGAQRG